MDFAVETARSSLPVCQTA